MLTYLWPSWCDLPHGQPRVVEQGRGRLAEIVTRHPGEPERLQRLAQVRIGVTTSYADAGNLTAGCIVLCGFYVKDGQHARG
jgi:hypothetical protein